MAILVSQTILNRIHDELSKSTESFLLISAYCKLPLVKYFDQCITNENITKTLIVRYRPEDITAGASDLDIYPYCKAHGWKMYFRLDLHAKTYVFDRLRCIVGSANATGSGLNLGGIGNYEMATSCELADADRKVLDLLLRGAVEMNDYIYSTMKDVISSNTSQRTSIISWPKEISELFIPDYSILFAEDFPSCSDPLKATAEDLVFLNLVPGASLADVQSAFEYSKCYQWLLHLVKAQDEHEMYFGAITAKLHNTLLNEPTPFRKDVKQLLSNLLSWVESLAVTDLQVDRPNYSQRVRYINREV